MPPTEEENAKPKVFTWSQFLASISVSMGALCVGYTAAYTSPALPTMKVNGKFEVTDQAASWVGGVMPLAGLVGAIAGGPLIMYTGRRTTLMMTGVPFIIGWLMIAFAAAIFMVLSGRLLCGFAVGVATAAAPVYLGETLHPQVRGGLGIMPTLVGNLGLVTCFIIGFWANWIVLAFVGTFSILPFMILMMFVPETPRYRLTKNQPEKAEKALRWLRRKDYDVGAEMKELASVEETKSGWGQLCKRQNRKPLLIALGLMLFQQMSGINAVIFYTTDIFIDAGSSIKPELCTILVGLMNFAATLLATLVIDRLGRKILLYISDATMILTLIVLSVYFFLKSQGADTKSYGWVPLVAFVLYVMGFSMGFGPIPWLMAGEILPASIRGPGASVVVGFNWACSFVVTKTFQDFIDLIGTHGAFGIYLIFCLAALVFLIFFVPETKDKSLEEIEAELTGSRTTDK